MDRVNQLKVQRAYLLVEARALFPQEWDLVVCVLDHCLCSLTQEHT